MAVSYFVDFLTGNCIVFTLSAARLSNLGLIFFILGDMGLSGLFYITLITVLYILGTGTCKKFHSSTRLDFRGEAAFIR